MQLKTLNGDVAKVVSRADGQTRSLADALVRDTPVAYAFIAPAFFLLAVNSFTPWCSSRLPSSRR